MTPERVSQNRKFMASLRRKITRMLKLYDGACGNYDALCRADLARIEVERAIEFELQRKDLAGQGRQV